MVRCLDIFREYFARHADQFVLIGGTAATLAMEEAGLEFRATKDLDIVPHIEALNSAFGIRQRILELHRSGALRSPSGQRHEEAGILSIPETS